MDDNLKENLKNPEFNLFETIDTKQFINLLNDRENIHTTINYLKNYNKRIPQKYLKILNDFGFIDLLKDKLIKKVDEKYPNSSLLERAKLINYNILCYHGTDYINYLDVMNKGKFLSPGMMGTEGNEQRKDWFREEINEQAGALDQIFVTTNYSYAEYYANRSHNQRENVEGNYPLIITLNIPIWKFLEFKILQEKDIENKKKVIDYLNNKLIKRPRHLNQEVKSHWYKYFLEGELNTLLDSTPDNLDEMISLLNDIGRTELTLMRELPTEYISGATELNSNDYFPKRHLNNIKDKNNILFKIRLFILLIKAYLVALFFTPKFLIKRWNLKYNKINE